MPETAVGLSWACMSSQASSNAAAISQAVSVLPGYPPTVIISPARGRFLLERVGLQARPYDPPHRAGHGGFLHRQVRVRGRAMRIVQLPSPRSQRTVGGQVDPGRRDERVPAQPPMCPALDGFPIRNRCWQGDRGGLAHEVPFTSVAGSVSSQESRNRLRWRKESPSRAGRAGGVSSSTSSCRRRRAKSTEDSTVWECCGQVGSGACRGAGRPAASAGGLGLWRRAQRPRAVLVCRGGFASGVVAGEFGASAFGEARP